MGFWHVYMGIVGAGTAAVAVASATWNPRQAQQREWTPAGLDTTVWKPASKDRNTWGTRVDRTRNT